MKAWQLLGGCAGMLGVLSSSAGDSPPGLGGDWLGLRSASAAHGIELSAEYTSESATNLGGGERRRLRETGQLSLAATIDAAKLMDIEGGIMQITITGRHGEDLGAAAKLDVLQQVQEVYGRGQTWRLTQLWYEHQIVLPQGALAIKAGRVTVGEDFATFSCEFQNLTFCGAAPGNIVGEYWYNWPISQWGVRLKFKKSSLSLQTAVYEVNEKNLDKTFTIGHFSGGSGVLLPLEAAWSPTLNKRPGTYKLGGWYDTSTADDVLQDHADQPYILSGRPPRQHSGRHGFYTQFQQQLTGLAHEDKAISGWTVFTRYTQADRRTATVDRQLAVGLFLTGPLSSRPQDQLGLALGQTRVNPRAARSRRLDPMDGTRPRSEYAAELFYRIQVTPWLKLSPNLQWIHHPGGQSGAGDITVLGLTLTLVL